MILLGPGEYDDRVDVFQRTGIGIRGTGWPVLVAGLVLFCGSLYALALTGVRGFGAVTPIGGVAFLAAWAALACAAWKW